MSRVLDLLEVNLAHKEAAFGLGFGHHWRSDQEDGGVLRAEGGCDDVHDGHKGVWRDS